PPLPVAGGFNYQQFANSNVWRGADIITPNNWMYEGDEGNQDTGEMNGQMRAYYDLAIGNQTVDEPDVNAGAEGTSLAVQLADIFNGAADNPAGPFDNFPGVGFVAPAHSPHTDRGLRKPNTQGNVMVFEWGDTIKVVAWGSMHFDPASPNGAMLPTVHF